MKDYTVIAAFDIGERKLHLMVAMPGDHSEVYEQHDEPVMNEGLVPVWATVAARDPHEAGERFDEFFWAFKADEL